MRRSRKIANMARAEVRDVIARRTATEGPAVESELNVGARRRKEVERVMENQRRVVYATRCRRWNKMGAYSRSSANVAVNGMRDGAVAKPKNEDIEMVVMWKALGYLWMNARKFMVCCKRWAPNQSKLSACLVIAHVVASVVLDA